MLFALRQGGQRLLWKSKGTLRGLITMGEGVAYQRSSPISVVEKPYHLFIRLDGIGDFWLWLPFVAALRKAFPHEPFILLANPLWEELVPETGLFAETLTIRPEHFRRKPAYRREVLHALRTRLSPARYLWQTTYARRSLLDDLLAWALPAEQKIAWERTPLAAEPRWLGRWIDRQVYHEVRPSQLPPLIHEWIRYQHWLRTGGWPRLDFSIYATLRNKWQAFANGSPYLAIVLSSGQVYRVPPLSVLQSIIQAVQRRSGLPVYFFGTARERAMAEELSAHLAMGSSVNLCGQLSLLEAARKVGNAFVVVGPETGLVHIAATLGIPTLMIAGGGHWGQFVPYPAEAPFALKVLTHSLPCFGCGWHCGYAFSTRKAVPCIENLSPQKAVEEALSWLERLWGIPAQPPLG
ncbi:MAG: hypothetical protein N3A68_01215 [Bacteroidia bacterium]|jgi:ADP-heptose:LPS heptosyltransferase|nr:hypothetical protein [Bacteroidia bacterium]